MQGTKEFCRDGTVSRAFFTAFTVFLAVLFTILSPFASARAQDGQPGIMANGDLAVSGFSGTKEIGGQTFIDTDGASLKIFDVSGKGAPSAQVVNAPVKFKAFARDIGQVFGVALDNAPNPNIYATSTTVHGLKIVIPDNNGDGVPERVNTGQPGAMFMDGQFGTTLGGGPGTVWRIDGTTGEVSRFADITFGGIANSGPGLGNIAFDPAHFQFYVSDLDTGAIHRLDLSGNNIGIFDHGVDGRPAAGLAAVAMNAGDRMDITSLAFDSTNSSTWGFADAKRRVWGLAYFKGRLYYSVADGSQIWSVSINTDGSFGSDARVEIQAVPGGLPVSDILFTPKGRMVLAQRGGILSEPDYSRYHQPKQNSVLRYSRDLDGNWIQDPDEYAIGFPVDHKNASGGVGLSCDGTLWSTGDALRNDPAQSASLLPGGPLVVHGLQGNNISNVRPFNVPPRSSWFVDYKGQPAAEQDAGHVGDVEVYRNCPGGRAESFPGWYPIPEWYPPEGWVPPPWWPRTPDLDLEKIASKCVPAPGLPGSYLCDYTIVVTNVGAADYVGHLNVVDNPPATALFIPPPGGSIPWNCAQPGGAGTPISCDSTNVETLHPGEAETLDITIQVTPAAAVERIRNCAIVDDFLPGNNADCDEADIPRPDLDIKKTFSHCFWEGVNQRCVFVIKFENVGGSPYSGPLHFVENVPAGTIFGGIFAATTPGWGCVGGPPINCTLPDPPGVTMNPGDVELVGITVIVPPGVGGNMNNCVNLGVPEHADDPVGPGVNNFCEPFTTLAPIMHQCPAGWTEVPPGGAPAGWLVIAVDGVNADGTKWGMMCMKPKPKPKPPVHKCPTGWTKVPPQGAPAGYQVLAVDGINPDGTKWGMMCMKPKHVDQQSPSCKPGERKYQSLRLVPKGWTSRKVTLGKRSIYCAKPRVLIPLPSCNKGEKTFSSSRLVPKGWASRKVTLGKVTIYCARPRVLTPQKPMCAGGNLLMLKTLPPRWICKCPSGKQLVRGRCVRKPVLCPKGWSKVKGKCKPPRIQTVPPKVKLCPKGWKRIRGVCKPPQILTIPPKVKYKPNGRYNPSVRLKPIMQLNPSNGPMHSGPSRRFR